MFEPLNISHIPGNTNTAADALSRNPALMEAGNDQSAEIPELNLSFLGEAPVMTP